MRLFCVLIALLGSTTASLAYNTMVDGWHVQNSATNNPPFVGCIMTRRYNDQTNLSILVSTDYEWAIGIANQGWQMQKGMPIDMAVRVDGKFIASGKAIPLGGKSAVLPISGAAPYARLQAGQRLDLDAPSGSLAFTLVGASSAMYTVLECVKTLQPIEQPAKSMGKDVQIVSP